MRCVWLLEWENQVVDGQPVEEGQAMDPSAPALEDIIEGASLDRSDPSRLITEADQPPVIDITHPTSDYPSDTVCKTSRMHYIYLRPKISL